MDISDIIEREVNLFEKDIELNHSEIEEIIQSSSFLVIGGAGSIGQAVSKEIFKRDAKLLHVVDLNENDLVEFVRDVRSSIGYSKGHFSTFCLDANKSNLSKLFEQNNGYDFVLNLSALKHVRSEKDAFSLQRMFEVNILNTVEAYKLSKEFGAKNYFCVSTDKAANPVNLMGASKRAMEIFLDSIFEINKFSSARFANVAFSNGSLLDGFISRLEKKQPISAPNDIRRYFLTHEEAGRLCLLSSLFGSNGEIYFPKLDENLHLINFKSIAINFLKSNNLKPFECSSEDEARNFLKVNKDDGTWPCLFFGSDTTGEKPFEEFFTSGESLVLDHYEEIGIVKNSKPQELNIDFDTFIDDIDKLFLKKNYSKENIISLFKKIISEFDHEDKGRSLENKM
tara:strand:- start:3692 stop:4882 length:1191 start_codon:yes stop_codon:yes gene_type:complete